MIYILCPKKTVTGGPEALHQLCYYLGKKNIESMIIYIDWISKKENPVSKQYEMYNCKIGMIGDIVDCNTNTIIYPEVYYHFLNAFKNVNKYVWWLSVDNYHSSFDMMKNAGNTNKLKMFLKYILKSNYKTYLFFKESSKYDNTNKLVFAESTKHLTASYYANDFLKKNNIESSLFIEPIGLDYLLDSNVNNVNTREDIVLYNPLKGIEVTSLLIEKCNNIKFVPIKNMNHDQMVDVMTRAKLYIDFGHFPGAERLPKEAVLCNCCIITGTKGASNYFGDVPIDLKFKFSSIEQLDEIVAMINNLLNNYENEVINFKQYKDTVLNLENNFLNQMDSIFNK